MQQTTIIGHLGANASVNNVNGENVVNFNVAVSERWTTKDGEKKEVTTWFSCSYWNREKLAPYLLKGGMVCVAGKITADTYKDKNGVMQAALRLNVDRLNLLDKKQEEKPVETAAPNAPTPVENNANNTGSADDLPF